MDALTIKFIEKLPKSVEERMSRELIQYEAIHGIDVNYKRFSIVLEEEGHIAAALNAYTAFSEIYVDDIWVEETYRGRGYGKKLLQALEEHFKGQGFNNINLVTSAFQAPGFYKKCGFSVEFVRENVKNPKLTKTFFVKYFEEDVQNQGILNEAVVCSSKKKNDHLIIGISGISGAGKSTLISKLQQTLQATALFWDEYDAISQAPEDYVKWYETSRNYADWIYPDLAKTLRKLKEGQVVICPATQHELFPTKYILFDAPLGYCHQETGQYIDYLICLDTPSDIALARRLLRDCRHQPEKIIEELDDYLNRSRPLFVLTPEEKGSDLIIDGSLSVDEQEQGILRFLKNQKPR